VPSAGDLPPELASREATIISVGARFTRVNEERGEQRPTSRDGMNVAHDRERGCAMKTMAVVLGVLLLALGAACGGDEPSAAEAEASFCSSLSSFRDTVNGIGDLSLSSSADDVRALGDEISSAWDDVEEAAADVRDVEIDDLSAAVDDFTQAIEGISSSTSITEIVEIVQSAASVVTGAVSDIASGVDCENA
jgi:hypothetical protein